MRLFLISVGTLTITLLIGFIVRFWGLSLPYQKFEHPFFNHTATQALPVRIPVLKTDHFQYQAESKGQNASFASRTIESQTKPLLLWVNIYITADHILFSDYGFDWDAFMTWAREKKLFKGKYPHAYKMNELTAFGSEILSLETVVKAFPDYQFIFNILSNDLDIHKEMIQFVETNKLVDRVLVNSPVDIIIKSIKKSRPMWIYGTSIPEVARVKSFSTLGLEPAISVRGDVFVAPLSYLNRRLVDALLVNEMKRRKKFVFIGPLVNQDEIKDAEELNPDAIIF